MAPSPTLPMTPRFLDFKNKDKEVMTMLNKIRDHPTHTALAIGMVAIGVFLIINDNYFIWPPHYSDWLNDEGHHNDCAEETG